MKKTIKELRTLSKEELIKELMENRKPIDVGFTFSFGCKPVFKIQAKKNMSLYVRYQQIESGLSVIRYDTTMHQSDIFYMVEDSYTFRVQRSVNSTNLEVSAESFGFSDYDSLPVTLIDSKFSLVVRGIRYSEMSEDDMTRAEAMLTKYFNLKVL